MKNSYPFKTIVSNLGLKIVGLFLALMLWFHVATNREYETSFDYSLDYVNTPDSLVFAVPPPATVKVTAHGSGKELLRTLWKNRRWPIDLSTARVGSVSVAIDPSQVPVFGVEGVRITGIDGPRRLTLVFDSVAEKTVPIVSTCTWETAPGFVRVGSEEWTPSQVTVRGPRNILDSIRSVCSKPVDIRAQREPVDREVELDEPSAFGVSIIPKRAHLRQLIEPLVTRDFAGLAVHVATTKSRDTVYVLPPTVTVTVAGPRSAMEQAVPESVAVVCAVSEQDTTGTRRSLWVYVSEPLQVLKTVPDSVTVQREPLHGNAPRN